MTRKKCLILNQNENILKIKCLFNFYASTLDVYKIATLFERVHYLLNSRLAFSVSFCGVGCRFNGPRLRRDRLRGDDFSLEDRIVVDVAGNDVRRQQGVVRSVQVDGTGTGRHLFS